MGWSQVGYSILSDSSTIKGLCPKADGDVKSAAVVRQLYPALAHELDVVCGDRQATHSSRCYFCSCCLCSCEGVNCEGRRSGTHCTQSSLVQHCTVVPCNLHWHLDPLWLRLISCMKARRRKCGQPRKSGYLHRYMTPQRVRRRT